MQDLHYLAPPRHGVASRASIRHDSVTQSRGDSADPQSDRPRATTVLQQGAAAKRSPSSGRRRWLRTADRRKPRPAAWRSADRRKPQEREPARPGRKASNQTAAKVKGL
jgi:hypothetical protein